MDLKGYWSSALAHANWQPTAENVPERLDRLAHEGMARVVVAFPDCFTKLFGNQYLNSAGSGRYADYLCDEIVAVRGSSASTAAARAGAACSANRRAAMARRGMA